MNKTSFFIVVFLILTGCFACNSPASKPSEILPLDTVAAIVADCFFIEGEIYSKQWSCNIKDYSSAKYGSLFEQHRITKEIFVQNVKFYFLNEKYSENIMNKVDELVEQRVSALRDSLNLKQ
jgi:hypothetical protein